VEPCAMCCGAALHARVARVVYGARDPKAGAVESLYRLLSDERMNHRVPVSGGVLADESAALLREFFETRRRLRFAVGWPSPVDGVRLEIG
jgi:tRNA(adenine34) deaminase